MENTKTRVPLPLLVLSIFLWVLGCSAEKPLAPRVELSNGLVIQDLAIGFGARADVGDTLATHYVGHLQDGTRFDSSYDRGQPFTFIVGVGQVIRGWDLGVPGMRVGGRRRLTIPPELAYGDRGAGTAIPPNATLIFNIDLVRATPP